MRIRTTRFFAPANDQGAGGNANANASGAAGAQGQQGAGQQQAGQGAGQQGGQQGGNPAWYDGLGPDDGARQLLGTKKWANINEVARSYAELESAIGKKGTIVPTDKDPPEAWNGFYKALPGYPESADKYTPKVRDGAEMSDGEKLFFEKMRPAFHKHGLTQRQVDGIIQDGYFLFCDALTEQSKAAATKRQADADALAGEMKTRLGPKGIAAAQRALEIGARNVKDPAKRQALIDKGAALMGDADFLEFLAGVGANFGEGGGALNPSGADGGGGVAMTPDEAKAKLAANAKNAVYGEELAGKHGRERQKAAHDEMMRLNRIVNAGAKK